METKELSKVLLAAPLNAKELRVDWLVRALADLKGIVGARVFAVSADESGAFPNDRELLAASSFENEETAKQLNELVLFGERPVIGDLRQITFARFEGSHEHEPRLSDEHEALQVRIRLDYAIAWFQIFAEKHHARFDNSAGWVAGIVAITHVYARGMRPAVALRRKFLDRLATYHPQDPDTDFTELCEAWCVAMRAKAAGLWLSDKYDPSRSYELAAWYPGDARPAARAATGLRQQDDGWVGAAGHYACRRENAALWIDDVSSWKKKRTEKVEEVLAPVEYRVCMRDELTRLKCPALCLVPLRDGTEDSGITSLVSLHYEDDVHKDLHDHDSVAAMARASSQVITRSQEHEQHEILKKLNSIAGRYLAEPGRLSAQRPEYVKDVIKLVQTRLRVELVSIFWKSRFEKTIECIGTTGLYDVTNNRKVPADALAGAKYQLSDERIRTVECFNSGKPIVTTDLADDRAILFSERRTVRDRMSEREFDPSVYVPIPDPVGGEEGTSLGVIRCFRHKSAVFEYDRATFDHVDLDTLGFIAEQIAPILKIFEYRMQKEQAVISVKHDLNFPTRMGTDAIDSLFADFEAKREIRRLDLADLRTTMGFIKHLIAELEPDPQKRPEIRPRKTWLEGDIVARLRAMLQPMADEKKMRIRFDGFREIPALSVDRDYIERALFNLIINAIKYGRRGTEVWIRGAVRDEPPFYEIDVINEGEGIPSSVLEDDLYLPGYRAPNKSQHVMGMGLGLTLAKAAIEAHRGNLKLANRQGPTIFRVQLPK